MKVGANLLDQLRRILQQVLTLGQLVKGVYGEHSVLPNKRVSVLKAGENGGNEWLQYLLLPDATQEA